MNTPIRIIDSNFNLLGEIDDYESLIFIRKFYKVGEFELHININKNNVDKLQEDNLIILGNNVKKVGVIRHREIQLGEQGEATETLIVKGYTLKGVLGRRIIVPPVNQAYDNVIGSQEFIMKQFVYNNVVNPSDINRKILQVIIAPNKNRGKEDRWRGRFEKLTDKLQEVGEYAELGWDIYLDVDNNKWVFDVIEGRNLTANQETLPPVIFSVDFDNIKGQTYIDSAVNYSNVGYAAGKGEEEDRLIQQVGEASGINRIESFLDCSNAEDIIEVKEQGNKKIKELKRIKTFESQVIDFGSFIYMKDWDLGDIVTVQNRKWNVTMNSRVVEIKEIYEVGGFNLELTFGNNIPTILDKIKNLEKQKLVEAKTGVAGINGSDGKNGKSIEFSWNGTELGIKQEGKQEYNYVNLKGTQGNTGQRGHQGIPGIDGISLEFIWNDTSLGIRKEGDTDYSYVNLKGEKGEPGLQGPKGTKGDKGVTGSIGSQGDRGPQGKSIEYTWDGTQLGVRQQGESTYKYVQLKGSKGDRGDTGPAGPRGLTGVKGPKGNTGERGPQGVQGLKGTKGDTGSQGIQGERGPKGDKGAIGPKGPQGVSGKNGSDANVNKTNIVKALGFTPSNSTHKHKKSEITDFPTTLPANGGTSSAVNFIDNRSSKDKPKDLQNRKLTACFKYKSYVDNPPVGTNSNYVYILNIVGWNGFEDSGGWPIQLAVGKEGLAYRQGINSEKWGKWNKISNNKEIPTKLSQLQNDIGAGGGTNIVCSKTEPRIKQGEWWYKE